MKNVKIILIVSILILCSQSFADSAAKMEAEKLLNIMNMEYVLKQSIEQTLDLHLQQNSDLLPYKDVMLKFFEKYMSYESLKPDMVRIYADVFTEVELEEMNMFYRTPTGKKALQKLPVLMSKGSQIGAQRVQENIHVLQQMIKDESDRIQQLQNE